MKTASTLLLLLALTGCSYLEARSVLRQTHAVEFPTTEEAIIEIAGCRSFAHRMQIADRFLVNPGASFTNWYPINDGYDLVIQTDSTTGYQVLGPDHIWIEKRSENNKDGRAHSGLRHTVWHPTVTQSH